MSTQSTSIKLGIRGMSCGHCKSAVENALKSVEGVQRVEVDLQAGRAEVSGQAISTEALVAAVVEEGYEASITVA